ncbi:MAG: transcriptional regulator [Actinobacteria bacterium RBG_13_63_9]|nr:MAG: transcriptional regulator [Actinobacteria bacterium RBG_13_63_9]
MSALNRDLREIARDELLMRRRILEALESGALTVPGIAQAIERPAHEAMYWVMGMRKYGYLVEVREANEEGFYLYEAAEREGA